MNGGGNWRELRTDPHNAALLLSLPPGPITAGPALSLPAEGVAFQRNHRYDEAAAVFAATLAGRFDPAVSAALAHCLLFGGKFARAHEVLRQMVYAFPRNGRAFRMLAALFKQVGNPALTKQYEQISRQFPREADESAELAGKALAGMREKARELVRAGNPARAIPAIRQFLAASPYSREGHLWLLFCHYEMGDWVEMGKLLKKLMKHTMTFVESRHFSRQLKTDFRNSPAMRRNVPDRTEFLKPTFCLVDENSRDLREDPEMVGISFPANCQFFFVVRYLLLRDQLEPAKTLLVAYRKTYDFLLSSRQPSRVLELCRRDDSRGDPLMLEDHRAFQSRGDLATLVEEHRAFQSRGDDVFVGGESALDDTIWPYSVHVMLLAAHSCVLEIMVISVNRSEK